MSEKQKNEVIAAPIEVPRSSSSVESTGFLPIETNKFDRVFISIVIWVALSLFWFRFVEPAGFSIWISNAIALAVAALIISKG